MQILTGYGKTDIIVGVITVLYKNTFAKVLSAPGNSEFFEKLGSKLQSIRDNIFMTK